MAISTEIVGKTFGPFVRDYTFEDLEICALGCGAGWDGRVDLEYVNEHDAKNPDLKVLPIFAVPLTVNEEMTTTLDYGFDYSGSLHYGIDVHFHAPFKMSDHIETYVTQEAIWDRGEGRGSLSKQVGKSYSADGTHLCTVDTYDCCIYDGGWGGEQPPRDSVEYPDREPDFTYEETYGYNWPLVYRLMGDWHQQHIDWSYTEQTGLERPIAHGVSSAGVAIEFCCFSMILLVFSPLNAALSGRIPSADAGVRPRAFGKGPHNSGGDFQSGSPHPTESPPERRRNPGYPAAAGFRTRAFRSHKWDGSAVRRARW